MDVFGKTDFYTSVETMDLQNHHDFFWIAFWHSGVLASWRSGVLAFWHLGACHHCCMSVSMASGCRPYVNSTRRRMSSSIPVPCINLFAPPTQQLTYPRCIVLCSTKLIALGPLLLCRRRRNPSDICHSIPRSCFTFSGIVDVPLTKSLTYLKSTACPRFHRHI